MQIRKDQQNDVQLCFGEICRIRLGQLLQRRRLQRLRMLFMYLIRLLDLPALNLPMKSYAVIIALHNGSIHHGFFKIEPEDVILAFR